MAIPIISINYVAIIVVAIVQMILGSLWYGAIFRKAWITLSGLNPKDMEKAKKKGMGPTYLMALIASLISAYVLAHFVRYIATSLGEAFQLAVFIWLGFVAPMMLGVVLWEGKSTKLYLINSGYYLVSLIISALILVAWR